MVQLFLWRSKGGYMPKVRKTKARELATILSHPQAAQYTAIYEPMLQSPAWKALPVQAKILYFEMRREYAGRVENEYHLSFTYQKAQELTGMSPCTIKKMFRHLTEKGFITVQVDGSSSRTTNFYAFTTGWKSWNRPPQEKATLEANEGLAIAEAGRAAKK